MTRLEEIKARCEAATRGPWAFANTCEKGYGANVGAGCIAEADTYSEHPLSGDLTERTDDYYVDQPVASLDHQNASADAKFIAHARSDMEYLTARLTVLADALAFYANAANWKSPSKGFVAQYDPEPSAVAKDAGSLARAALEGQ